MDLYNTASAATAKLFTEKYSTSFQLASRLFDKTIRPDIYNVYGLVRIADEIVDTYHGKDAKILLDDLETEVYAAIGRGYSVNPIVHAFQITANSSGITQELIKPFFASMRTDLGAVRLNQKQYHDYIYGSAEVVGLMCLKVFVNGDSKRYEQLKPGAQRLGSAYQKVNFLRDFAHDSQVLNRSYFPAVDYKTFNDAAKAKIIKDIEADFAAAEPYVKKLPQNARAAVATSYRYYSELLKALQSASANDIKTNRIRLPNAKKLAIFVQTGTSQKLLRRA